MTSQLLLFRYPKTDIEELNDDMEAAIEKIDNFRKSFFKKMSTMSSQITTLEARINILEAQLYVMHAFIENHMECEE